MKKEKYDIILNFDGCRWITESAHEVVKTVEGFIYEWQDDFRIEPSKCNLILGIHNYDLLKLSKDYNDENNLLNIHDLDIRVFVDWSFHRNYMELTLSE